MEELWAELSRTPETVPVPDWHREVLNIREQAVADGEAVFSDQNSWTPTFLAGGFRGGGGNFSG
jgi:hypothetical protein